MPLPLRLPENRSRTGKGEDDDYFVLGLDSWPFSFRPTQLCRGPAYVPLSSVRLLRKGRHTPGADMLLQLSFARGHALPDVDSGRYGNRSFRALSVLKLLSMSQSGRMYRSLTAFPHRLCIVSTLKSSLGPLLASPLASSHRSEAHLASVTAVFQLILHQSWLLTRSTWH